jgi:hypothetical protein
VDLVSGAGQVFTQAHWTSQDLATIAAGVGPDGRKLASFGYKAAERLGWTATFCEEVRADSRVARMAAEAGMGALRAGATRERVVRAILATWLSSMPTQAWFVDEATRRKRLTERMGLLPRGTSVAWVANLSRRVGKHVKEHGLLPHDLSDLEDAVTGRGVFSGPGRRPVRDGSGP